MKDIHSYIFERLVINKTQSTDSYIKSIVNDLLNDKTNKGAFEELTRYANDTFEKVPNHYELKRSKNYNELHYLIIQDVLQERSDGKLPKRIVNCGTKIDLNKYNNNRIVCVDPKEKQQNYLKSILTIYDNDSFEIDDMIYLGSNKTNKILTTDIYLVDKEFVDIFKECIYKFEKG